MGRSFLIYNIYIPELAADVKFKVFDQDSVKELLSTVPAGPRYKSQIIERIVYNMKTDVVDSLRHMSTQTARRTVEALYNCAVMLNPGIDPDLWINLAYYNTTPEISQQTTEVKEAAKPSKHLRISYKTLDSAAEHLNNKIIGQSEAIDTTIATIKRSLVGLTDEKRPLGVFLLCGPSGVGKTQLVKELQHAFYSNYSLLRIDCGEFQHKHENQKLLGAPAGYTGYEDGGLFSNFYKNPNRILLIDEVEKAHPDIWDTFLRLFDEGKITDSRGREISVSHIPIFMTSNLGNSEILEITRGQSIGFGDQSPPSLPTRERSLAISDKYITKTFKPEFLGRIDQIIVFNHLTPENLDSIAKLRLGEIGLKLKSRGWNLDYSPAVVDYVVNQSQDASAGARKLVKVIRDEIEDKLVDFLVTNTTEAKKANKTNIILDIYEGELKIKNCKEVN